MNIPRLLLVVALAAAPVLASACTVNATLSARWYVKPTSATRVDSAPPPLRDEGARPEAPSASSVWVSGHWSWEGRWVWKAGHWQEDVRPDHVWEPPVCVADEGEYHLYPGYFRPEAEEPPPIYREPGHIQLHVPVTGVQMPVSRIPIEPDVDPPTQTVTPGSAFVPAGTVDPGDTGGGDTGGGDTGGGDTGGGDTGGGDTGGGDTGGGDTGGGDTGGGDTGGGDTGGGDTGGGDTGGGDTGGGDTGGGDSEEPAFECRLASPNAPRNGQITVHGATLDDTATVTIGGDDAAVIRVRGEGNGRHLQARVPRDSDGGEVQVTMNEQTVTCGTLTIRGAGATTGRGQGDRGNPGGGPR